MAPVTTELTVECPEFRQTANLILKHEVEYTTRTGVKTVKQRLLVGLECDLKNRLINENSDCNLTCRPFLT